MNEELMRSKLKELATQASAEKVRLVCDRDFEAAARWRDVEMALNKIPKFFVVIPENKIEVNANTNWDDWLDWK
jgi:hypothetical protein